MKIRVNPKLPPESFYPRQVLMDMAFALLLMVGLGFLAYFHPVQLGPIADPANTKFVPRPEWYYLPMFEWLKFWSSRMEVFADHPYPRHSRPAVFPVAVFRSEAGASSVERPIPLLAVTFVLVGMIFLGFKSHLDDSRHRNVAAQLAFQEKQDEGLYPGPIHPADGIRQRGAGFLGARLLWLPKGRKSSIPKGVPDATEHRVRVRGRRPASSGSHAKYPSATNYRLATPSQCEDARRPYAFIRLSAPDMTALFSYLGSLGK